MRRLLVVVFATVIALSACYESQTLPADADVCARATHLFASCGVLVPTLTGAPCTGVAKVVARCVVNRASDCDALAGLAQHLDGCVDDELDGGDILPPPTDLPVPFGSKDRPRDAGDDADADAGGPLSLVTGRARALANPPSPIEVST